MDVQSQNNFLCNLHSFCQFTLFDECDFVDVRSCTTASGQHSIKLESTYVSGFLELQIYGAISISGEFAI